MCRVTLETRTKTTMDIRKAKKVQSKAVSEPPEMSAKQFCAWLAAMNYTGAAAARVLGVSPATITKYQQDGAPASIRLACRVVYPRQGDAVFPWEVV